MKPLENLEGGGKKNNLKKRMKVAFLHIWEWEIPTKQFGFPLFFFAYVYVLSGQCFHTKTIPYLVFFVCLCIYILYIWKCLRKKWISSNFCFANCWHCTVIKVLLFRGHWGGPCCLSQVWGGLSGGPELPKSSDVEPLAVVQDQVSTPGCREYQSYFEWEGNAGRLF